MRRQSKRRTVTRIAFDRASEQFQRLLDPSPAPLVDREGTQVKIVRREIARRSFRRPSDFRSLERRLDDPGDAQRDLVLQIENVLNRAVKSVGPKVRTGLGLDQLPSDAHAITSLAN